LLLNEDRGNPDAMDVHVGAVNAAQRQLWRVRWDNSLTEVYWRLVLDGLACGERWHQVVGECVALGLVAYLCALCWESLPVVPSFQTVPFADSWGVGFSPFCAVCSRRFRPCKGSFVPLRGWGPSQRSCVCALCNPFFVVAQFLQLCRSFAISLLGIVYTVFCEALGGCMSVAAGRQCWLSCHKTSSFVL
jgi:hypothetical protein